MSAARQDKEKQAALKKLRRELGSEIQFQLTAQYPELGAMAQQHSAPAGESTDVPSWGPGVRGDPEAKRVVEAILFTASRPITTAELKRALGGYRVQQIEAMVRQLQAEYEREARSFRIQEIAGGFECATQPRFAPWILKLELQRRAKQATQSALESLAILAYKQPVTRAEIEDLRGVDVSGVLATLLERNLIRVVGRKEVPGRPFLYGTTDKFLQHFGLKSLKDLPDISEIKSLVENSVKREELFRTEKILSQEESGVPSEETRENHAPVEGSREPGPDS